jgi:hypothetical protein
MANLPEDNADAPDAASRHQLRLKWSEPRLQKLRGREALHSDTGSNDGNIISFS